MRPIFPDIASTSPPYIYKFFDGFSWKNSSSKKTIDVFSPVTGKVLGKIQSVTTQEIDKAIERAKISQREWQNIPIDKRVKILNLAADWIRELKKELTKALILEIGKTKKEAEDEILRTADLIDYFASEARSLRGEQLNSDSFPGYEKGKLAIISRVPLGLILAIAPFNYPINLSASKIAPALVTGNAVIFKPPTNGAISALHLVEIFRKAGVPDGLLVAVTGRGGEIGDYLVTHTDISMISFTGSSAVGKEIAKKAGMIPLLFECGGNNPAIVLEDTDFSLAATEIVKGAFSYSGQRCTAIKYVLAEEKVIKKLLPLILEKTKKIKVGDPQNEGVEMGPVINQEAAENIESAIKKAVTKKAKIAFGGKRNGLYFEPTILLKVTRDMRVVREEIFGPVLSFIKVENLNEAIEIINSSDYGLQACIFTKDEGKGIKIAEKIEVGTVQVNGRPQRGPDHFPFLGIKGSGVGVQGVRYTLEAMTRLKPVVINKPE